MKKKEKKNIMIKKSCMIQTNKGMILKIKLRIKTKKYVVMFINNNER